MTPPPDGIVRSGCTAFRWAIALLACLTFGPAPALAGVVGGYVEISATDSTSETTENGAVVDESSGEGLIMTTNLEWFGRPSSTTSFRIAGFFQRTNATFDSPSAQTDSTTTRIRPYFGFDVRSDNISASVNYQHDRLDLDDTRLLFDQFGGFLNWTPDRLPSIRATYLDSRAHDEDNRSLDRTERSFRLRSEYAIVESVRVDYQGSVFETDNRIDGTITRTTNNLLRGGYSDRMWDNRLTLSADARAGWRDVETRSLGTGDVTVPTFPANGLFLLTDTPEFDALAPNPLLIDGNRLTPAGPNLGLPPPGGETRLRNLGVEFVDPTASSVARVWIDREIPQAIALTFSWAIYVSDDNDLWSLHSTVAAAPFGPFENRFEFEYPEVTARFVKVAVAPLDSTVPQAANWPDILVTEIELLLRRPAGDIDTRTSRDEQSATAVARALLNRAYNAYFDTSYFFRSGSGRQTEWVWTNALSFRRDLGRIYGVGGRLERNDVQNLVGRDAFQRYSMRFSANPLPSLRHAVVFSGSNGSLNGLNSEDASVSLTSWARLYEGVEASLSLAKSYIDRATGERIEVDRFNFSTLITPHRSVRVRLAASTRSSDTQVPAPAENFVQFQRLKEISVTYSPVPSVYLYGSYRRQERDDADPQDTRRLQASFSPFPGGALRLGLELFEEYRPISGITFRRIVPNVRWNIRQGWLFEVTYTRATEDFVVLEEKRDTLFARLQAFF